MYLQHLKSDEFLNVPLDSAGQYVQTKNYYEGLGAFFSYSSSKMVISFLNMAHQHLQQEIAYTNRSLAVTHLVANYVVTNREKIEALQEQELRETIMNQLSINGVRTLSTVNLDVLLTENLPSILEEIRENLRYDLVRHVKALRLNEHMTEKFEEYGNTSNYDEINEGEIAEALKRDTDAPFERTTQNTLQSTLDDTTVQNLIQMCTKRHIHLPNPTSMVLEDIRHVRSQHWLIVLVSVILSIEQA